MLSDFCCLLCSEVFTFVLDLGFVMWRMVSSLIQSFFRASGSMSLLACFLNSVLLSLSFGAIRRLCFVIVALSYHISVICYDFCTGLETNSIQNAQIIDRLSYFVSSVAYLQRQSSL